VPEIVTMHLESASGASSAQITLSGFTPQTDYHKYEDDYHNHVAFTTDVSGSYTFTQDLSKPHLLFIQPRSSTIFLGDTGWSKSAGTLDSGAKEDDLKHGVKETIPPVGIWDPETRTATLDKDLTETIQIDSNNITLDGNGHTIANGGGIGIYLPERSGVTIKNLIVNNFSTGIYFYSSSNNNLTGNTISNNHYGIYQDGRVNQPPVANAGSPYMAHEGSPVTLDASGSTDPDGEALQYRWDFDNDGEWDSEWSSQPAVSHTWDDDYSGVVRLAVSDGLLTSISTAQVTITNSPPQVEAGSDQTAECCINEISFNGSFTDPGQLDTHTIDWSFGDGASAAGSLESSHHYKECGTFTVTLTVTDDDGGAGSDTMVVNIVDTTPPEVVACDNVVVEQEDYEGTEVTLSAEVCDSCDANPTVTWGYGPTAVFPLGVTVVKATATDKYENSASDEVVISVYGARTAKSVTIAKLDSAKVGDRRIDRKIDEVIKRINKSLDEKLWGIDDSHINPKHGVCFFHKVFHKEKAAVIHLQIQIKTFEREIPILEEIIAKKKNKGCDTSREEARLAAIETALPVFKEVVNDLVGADRILAIVAIGDAKNTEVQNPRFQRTVDCQIDRAERELDKAYQELGKEKPVWAIMWFEKAWQHAQLAIKFANKAR